MTLAACRECSQQVSTEASTCPHCGVSVPAHIGLPVAPPLAAGDAGRSGWRANPAGPASWARVSWLRWTIGLVALAGLGGWQLYDHRGVTASGDQIEKTIVDRFSNIAGTPITLYATCPKTVQLRKGKIVDCSIERSDNGKTTAVFITGTDNSGHYTMQVEDPSILISNF